MSSVTIPSLPRAPAPFRGAVDTIPGRDELLQPLGKRSYTDVAWQEHQDTVWDVVILTANSREVDAARHFTNLHSATVLDQGVTAYLGDFAAVGQNGARLKAMVCLQDETGSNESQALVNCLDNSNVKCRIIAAIGCAFGIHPNIQVRNEVLVSEYVLGYESVRKGQKDADRNIPQEVGGGKLTIHLKACVRHFNLTDMEPHTDVGARVGMVLCGQKLIDNQQFKQEILTLLTGESAESIQKLLDPKSTTLPKYKNRKVIGGEMEGTGIAIGLKRARNLSNVPFYIIKGVSDWGVNKNNINTNNTNNTETNEHATTAEVATTQEEGVVGAEPQQQQEYDDYEQLRASYAAFAFFHTAIRKLALTKQLENLLPVSQLQPGGHMAGVGGLSQKAKLQLPPHLITPDPSSPLYHSALELAQAIKSRKQAVEKLNDKTAAYQAVIKSSGEVQTLLTELSGVEKQKQRIEEEIECAKRAVAGKEMDEQN